MCLHAEDDGLIRKTSFKGWKTGKNIAVSQLSTACSLELLVYHYRGKCFQLRLNVDAAYMQKIGRHINPLGLMYTPTPLVNVENYTQ